MTIRFDYQNMQYEEVLLDGKTEKIYVPFTMLTGMLLDKTSIYDIAEIVLELKAEYPYITLECAIPCETQAAKWSEPLRDRYYRIAELCDKETMLQTHYTPDCMKKRNRYMVDQCDILLAVWDEKPSGTGSTVRYAQTQEKSIWIVNPNALEVQHSGCD